MYHMYLKNLLLVLVLSFPITSIYAQSDDIQVTSHQKNLGIIRVALNDLLKHASLIKKSIEFGSDFSGSLDCSAEVIPSRYKYKCEEYIKSKNAYEKLKNVESAELNILKMYSGKESEKVNRDDGFLSTSTIVKAPDIAPYSFDKEAPNCKAEYEKNWKCLYTTITLSENRIYNILLKWNRPNISSRGSVLFAGGGNGLGDSERYPANLSMMKYLDTKESVRSVVLEMKDEVKNSPFQSGYWIHGGGFFTGGEIIMEIVNLAIEKKIFKGNFLNFLGGSAGTYNMSSALARFNADMFFDRLVLQMGPALPDLKTACDKQSASSLYLNKGEKLNFIETLFGIFRYKDANKSICSDLTEDRMSTLKGGKLIYPNTHVHVVIGALEPESGIGPWILASNLEWFNSIEAKSKSRIVRANMAHVYSYEDTIRFLKLDRDGVVDNKLEKCEQGSFYANDKLVEYSCGCGWVQDGEFQADGCFHKLVEGSGLFCNKAIRKSVRYVCNKGPQAGWSDVGGGCYHLATNDYCE